MRQIFISYARSDAAFALKLAERLKNEGHNIWIDSLHIRAGKRWDQEIAQAIKESHIFLVILSPSAVKNENVLNEIAYAVGHSLNILPISLLRDHLDLPFSLWSIQGIDFTGGFDTAFHRCLEELNRMPMRQTPETISGSKGGDIRAQSHSAGKPAWPRCERVRVSMAALLRIERNDKYLLVRNRHRPRTFSPFGGVFKYDSSTTSLLHDIGFETESADGHEKDLARDLRGFLPAKNLSSFLEWFHNGQGRELHDSCLRRELREELLEARIDARFDIRELTFARVRKIEEKETIEASKFDQYRYIEVYEPAIDDTTDGPGNKEFVERLFSNLPSVMMTAETQESLLDEGGALSTGDRIARTVTYLFSNRVRDIDEPMQGEIISSEAVSHLRRFVKSGASSFIRNAGHCSDPILLHRVQKRGITSYVASLDVDATPAIIKYYTGPETHFQKEVWGLRNLKDIVSIPRLLDWGETKDGPAYIITERLKGMPLSELSPERQIEKIPEIVREVLNLRQFRRQTYGEIVGTYDRIPNQPELGRYVSLMVTHWLKELRRLSGVDRAAGLDRLQNWAEKVSQLDPCGAVWSATSNAPCVCHSDVKPQDIFLTEGRRRPVLLDFDNIFSFIPEFDLCKFHFGLAAMGVYLELDQYAKIVKVEAGGDVSNDEVWRSLVSVYPYVCCRLLNWAIPREAQTTIDRVAAVLNIVELPKLFGLEFK